MKSTVPKAMTIEEATGFYGIPIIKNRFLGHIGKPGYKGFKTYYSARWLNDEQMVMF